MPTYLFICSSCGWQGDINVKVADRDSQRCECCNHVMARVVAAPLFKFMGRVTPGGGPDKFTADMLGIPLKDLPEGLRTK